MIAAARYPAPALPAGHLLAVTVDALVSGVHFPEDTAPADVACKALAVNLSDLAAMGAEPVAVQVECAAPGSDGDWAERVTGELDAAAAAFRVAVRWQRCEGRCRRIAVQAMGHVPRGAALTRAGARPGDTLWASGTLGDAGGGLAVVQGRLPCADADHRQVLLERLARPQPRVALGRALRGTASAAIDLSDGIAGDAAHLARRSGVAVVVQASRLPLSRALLATAGPAAAQALALSAGDDYELLFTAPAEAAQRVRAAAAGVRVAVREVGRVRGGAGLRIEDADGRELPAAPGYQHFATPGGTAP